eukprot:1770417-Rhodomonas_salina.1
MEAGEASLLSDRVASGETSSDDGDHGELHTVSGHPFESRTTARVAALLAVSAMHASAAMKAAPATRSARRWVPPPPGLISAADGMATGSERRGICRFKAVT